MDKLANNYQLSRWLSMGCGEYKLEKTEEVGITWVYFSGEESNIINSDIKIRKWGTKDWVVPYEVIIESDVCSKTLQSIF